MVEHETLNLRVVGSSPTWAIIFLVQYGMNSVFIAAMIASEVPLGKHFIFFFTGY